jgi:hypothetical protein
MFFVTDLPEVSEVTFADPTPEEDAWELWAETYDDVDYGSADPFGLRMTMHFNRRDTSYVNYGAYDQEAREYAAWLYENE